MGILATYRAYMEHEPQYNDWQKSRRFEDSKKEFLSKNGAPTVNSNPELLQKKAQVVAKSILVLDNYAQSKAEDVETVFQTIQMELLAGLSAVTAIPSLIPSLQKHLEKISNKPKFIEKSIENIQKYKNTSFKFHKYNIPAAKFLTGLVGAVSALIYIPTVKDAVINQIGATRRAKFEGMNKELSNIKDFAVLSSEQEEEVKHIMTSMPADKAIDGAHSTFAKVVTAIVDRVNIPGSIECVNGLMKDKKIYQDNKKKYDSSLMENEKYFTNPLTENRVNEAEENRELFQSIIKKVDVESQDSLERIEKLVNVGYSATIGSAYVESLLSEKLVDAMKVKTPVLKAGLSFGIPLLTYMILNKNLANLQNSAIKAVRYKKLNELVNNKDNFNMYSQEQIDSVTETDQHKSSTKKENIFKFLKGIFKDIKDYRTYQNNELEEQKKYLNAKRKLILSPTQMEDAKELQRNAFMTINKVDDNNQKYSESIETISEIALAPIELASPIIGGFVGKTVASKMKFIKNQSVFKALGIMVGFLPGALAEIYTTGMQRKALKISGMISSKELDDNRKFVNYDNKSFKQLIESSFAFNAKRDMASPFIAFQKQLKND